MSVALSSLAQTTPRKGTILASLGTAPWAVADQMLISATNFFTIILLARGFSQASLGSFTLVYSALLFVNSIQAGLVTQPHNIIGATRRGEDYARYTTATALSQLLLASASAVMALGAWGVASQLGWSASALVLALAPAIVAWQSQEFVRRVLYTEGRVAAALANDVLSYGGQALAIAGLWWNMRLTGPLAFYVIAWSSALGAVVGIWQIRASLSRRVDWSAFRENWHFGKWIAGGEIFGHWLSAQLFVYLAAAMLGAAAAGVLRAVHTVFGPSRVLADVFCTMLPIRFARTLADDGKAAMHTQLKAAYAAAVPLLGGYCLVVAVAAQPILWVLYGEKYLSSNAVLALYGVSAFASYMTMIVAAALRATRLTRQVFMGQLQASLIAFPIAFVMIVPLGIQGTVLGMISTYLAMMLLLYRSYRQQHGMEQARVGTAAVAAASGGQPAGRVLVQPDGVGGAGLMMLRVFHLLDEAGIPYCVLHGYGTYPQSIPSDVDCMIPGEYLPHRLARLLHENRERIGARVVQWIHAETHYAVLAGRNPDGSVCFLQLDISPSYSLAKRVFYGAEEVLQTRRPHDGYWIPSPGIEFGCYVVRRVVKRSLTRQHERVLGLLYRQDPAVCQRELRRFWSKGDAERIAAAAGSGDWESVRGGLGGLRRRLLLRSAIRQPRVIAGNWLAQTGRRVRRWAWGAQGLSVVFLGPDGSGKSSVVRAVRQDLVGAFFSTRVRSFPPAMLNRGLRLAAEALPHDVKPRSWVSSVVRAVAYWFVYHTAGHLFTTRKDLARFTLVLHDRHLVDALVDPRRYRYSGPGWLLRMIWACVPKPDMVILLDAPAEVVRGRKQDLPLVEIAQQREAYWGLVGGMANGHIVDGSQPLGQVVAEVDELIVRHLAERATRGLGLARPGRTHPQVMRVLRQFLHDRAVESYGIEALGHGDQADVFIVRTADGRPIVRQYDEVVVKLYRASVADDVNHPEQEYDSLLRLNARLDGKSCHGWTIRCPKPLYRCQRPLALVMTKVPGRSFNRWLSGGSEPAVLHSAGQAAIQAMREYWSAEGQLYGDLDFNNILCDPSTMSLSFVDPGIPESTYVCAGVSRDFYPASRDLAYMLFDVAASLKASMTNPRIRRRQKHFVEANLRCFIEHIDAARERRRVLEEIRACTQIHVRRINWSWSPAGMFRFIVRRNASRCVGDIIGRLLASTEDRGGACSEMKAM